MGLFSLLFSLPLGIVRTLISVVKTLVLKSKSPLRIDLPLPFIPVDVVLISDAQQLIAANNDSALDHLHAVETKRLPRWVQWYFSGTHFHNGPRDKWFLAFESKSNPSYAERRATHDKLVASEYKPEDVQRVATLIRSNADDQAIAEAVAQMVIGNNLLGGKEIPSSLVSEARTFLSTNITDALVPGHYSRSKKAQEDIYKWCAANGTPPGLEPSDVVHSFGAVINKLTFAIGVVRSNPDVPIETLFTIGQNTPTPNTPRIVVQRTTVNGILSYPGVPEKTVVILKNSDGADQTKSLFFTLGCGLPNYRVCAFKSYFEHFLGDLQQELRSNPPAATSISK